MPAQSSRSLTPKGTPASGPGSWPRARAASTCLAARRAPSGSRWTKALSSALAASIRPRASSSTSWADTWRRRTASAVSMADLIPSFLIPTFLPARPPAGGRAARDPRPPPGRLPRLVEQDVHRLAPDGGEHVLAPALGAGQGEGQPVLGEPPDVGALEGVGA